MPDDILQPFGFIPFEFHNDTVVLTLCAYNIPFVNQTLAFPA